MAQPTPFDIVPPEDTPEYMWDAYFSCFLWAIQFGPIQQEFLKDTGLSIPKPPTPIEEMVDKACEREPYLEFVRAFVPWFNQWVWGAIDEDADAE